MLLLNFNMRLYGNRTAWYRFLATDPSSGLLGGLTLYPHECQHFRKHGPRMRVDNLNAPFYGNGGACPCTDQCSVALLLCVS